MKKNIGSKLALYPMPIASFLEEYDFSGKTIIPFCSHGGGRFGQSFTAIAKLVPNAVMGEPLSAHYSGGSGFGKTVDSLKGSVAADTQIKALLPQIRRLSRENC